MHVALDRQLIALAIAVAAWLAGAGKSAAQPPASSAAEELQAAKIVEAGVLARGSVPAEMQRLEKIYRDLESRHPGNQEIANASAEMLWTCGKRSEAVAKWKGIESAEPKNAVVLDHLGGACLTLGDSKGAASYFQRAVAAAPENPALHFDVANVLFLFRHDVDLPETQAFALAAHHFSEASRLAPQNAEFARAYAEVFYALPSPDWRVALAAWEKFRSISPNKDFAFANLARVHMKLGEKDHARACLAQIRSTDFDRLKARLLQRIETE